MLERSSVKQNQMQESKTMEIDIQSRYVATVVAAERTSDHRREQIKLTRTLKVSNILHSIARLFN
jgi:hypothetical protein